MKVVEWKSPRHRRAVQGSFPWILMTLYTGYLWISNEVVDFIFIRSSRFVPSGLVQKVSKRMLLGYSEKTEQLLGLFAFDTLFYFCLDVWPYRGNLSLRERYRFRISLHHRFVAIYSNFSIPDTTGIDPYRISIPIGFFVRAQHSIKCSIGLRFPDAECPALCLGSQWISKSKTAPIGAVLLRNLRCDPTGNRTRISTVKGSRPNH